MKILLVRAPFKPASRSDEEFGEPHFWEPVALEVIGSSVSDHDVELLDMEIDPNLEETLDSFRPDVVGVECHSVPQVYDSRDTLKRIKEHSPEIFTVVGGFGVTALTDEFHKPYIDAIVLGEGEVTFRELVKKIGKGDDFRSIEGIAYSDNGKLKYTNPRPPMTDFEESPPPDRSLCKKNFENYTHFLYGTPMQLISSSKGCRFRCKFCCVWKRLNRVVMKSPERLVKELEMAEAANVAITDDNFFHDYDRVVKIAKMVKERELQKNEYFFFATVELIAKHPSLTEMWRSLANEMFIFMGMEGIDNKSLKNLGKSATQKQNEQALRILKQNDIPFLCSFICDTSFEKDDFKRIADFVVENEIPFPMFSILTPLPGSILYEERAHELITNDWRMFDFYNVVLPTKLPQEEFYQYFDALWEISKDCTIKYVTSNVELKDVNLDLLETFIGGYKRDRKKGVQLTS